MAGNVLDIDQVISPDALGTEIARYWHTWNMLRQTKMTDAEEVRRYIFATDTTQTTNYKLPWKNKTTIPKLCQIRDNLYANYMAAMFPKRNWLVWEGADEDSESKSKRESITNYMNHVINYDGFKKEFAKVLLDYIDYGNGFVMADWEDQSQIGQDGQNKVGYTGPVPKRIAPPDIVFNPVATSFQKSPKIIRSLLSFGEVKEYIDRLSTDENRQTMEELWNYLKGIRSGVDTVGTELKIKDAFFEMDGFTSYQQYLASDYVELLTFYGDIYNSEEDEFLRNQVIVVADRHKIITKKDNPSWLGHPPIYHVGWRVRQDNLWAMGPLDNLVGLQYRIDHVENLKADAWDLLAFPVLKIKGYVEDFEWEPFGRISIGDDGDVTILAPPHQLLESNVEVENLQKQMEEMAGAPKEAMGMRTPGEKTAYEVQRTENAASRIFTNKISQFEETCLEPWLNAALEMARRNVSSTSIRVFDNELKFTTFQSLNSEDLSGNGKIRPVAARHFTERAELVQNINSFFSSALGADEQVKAHFSSIQLAKMIEEALDLEDYELVVPYIRLAEQADSQRLAQAAQEHVMMEATTPSGLSQDDYDEGAGMPGGPQGPPPEAPQDAAGSLFGAAPPQGTSPGGPPLQ